MSETEKRKIKVFIASPNDLAEERRKFRSAIDVLNIGFGDGANVEFVALGWEDTLASTGRRSQGVINQDIDSCDVFILAMHRRWGQDAPDAAPYSSYTEEEFHRALERWKKNGAPEVFVFFKRVDVASEADPGPQLSKVIKFRQHLEETRQILYRYFDSSESFLKEVDSHLRAYAKDELPKAEDRDDAVVLPIAALQEVEKAKQLALQKTEEARRANDAVEEARLKIEEAQLEMAEVAAQLAMEGKVEFAREKFTKLVAETTDIQILFLGYEFFKRTGDLDSVVEVLEKCLGLSGAENETEETAAVLNKIGLLYKTIGELEQAEVMYRKSLAIYEAIEDKNGMALVNGNIGSLYLIRGELERAEEIYQRLININNALERKEGMAANYGNLGIVYQIQGELNKAEEMFLKSLAIVEELDIKECMADQYGNLGNLCLIRKKLESAEEMYQKSLVINELLDRKEGIANQFGNLGIVYIDRGELDQAEEMFKKSLALNEMLGRKEGMADAYGNLGVVYRIRGELERAEEMYHQVLVIEEQLGRKVSIAAAYCNLGIVCQNRREFDQAEKMYEKSISLYHEIGLPKEEKSVMNLLKKLRDSMNSEEDKIVIEIIIDELP